MQNNANTASVRGTATSAAKFIGRASGHGLRHVFTEEAHERSHRRQQAPAGRQQHAHRRNASMPFRQNANKHAALDFRRATYPGSTTMRLVPWQAATLSVTMSSLSSRGE